MNEENPNIFHHHQSFDNNTQLSLLLTCDHERKILKYRFYFFSWAIWPRTKRKKKKKGGFAYMGITPPFPPPPKQ
jgi:hypothetical protein